MIKNLLHNNFFLVTIGGVLLGFSWLGIGIPFLVFLAFIPVLWFTQNAIDQEMKNGRFFLLSFLLFALFNAITSSWVANAGGWIGLLAPVLVNGVMMSLTLLVYKYLLKKHDAKYAGWSFLAVWLAMEYLHSLNWDLSWPWMFIGYSISEYNLLYQWYEYTGVRGGTFWILGVNIGLYKYLRSYYLNSNEFNHTPFIVNNVVRISIPVIISVGMFYSDSPLGIEKKVRIVQPNIDPYTDKFDQNKYQSHKDLFNKLSFSSPEIKPDLIVLPETAIPRGIWDHELKNSSWIRGFENGRKSIGTEMMIAGLTSFKRMNPTELNELPLSYRQTSNGKYYEAYNSALALSDSGLTTYHKSRLVAGVEQLPFASYIPFLKKLAVDLGGTSGVLGTQLERTVFKANDLKVAPIICYESVYGEYLSEFVRNGANLIAIITNDGWWGNTAGYKQHFHYSRTRAVENRRYIVRSANTGISGIIDEKGNVVSSLSFWVDGTIDGKVLLLEEQTFFTKYGDWIGRLSAITALYFFLVAFAKKYRQQRLLHP